MKKILVVVALLAVVAVAGKAILSMYFEHKGNEFFAAYSPEVKQSFNDSFKNITLPSGVDDAYKAKAWGMLIGCLDGCLTPGKDLNFIPQKNCKPLCQCMTNGFIATFGSEFSQTQQSPAVQDQAVQMTRTCINSYKN